MKSPTPKRGALITRMVPGRRVPRMPFVKDFNELGAGTKGGVTAITEILGGLTAPFTVQFLAGDMNPQKGLWFIYLARNYVVV